MSTGLLAFALLAPAQPPAGDGPPPCLDPLPAGTTQGAGGYSFDPTHSGPPWAVWGGVDYRMLWLRPAPSPGVLGLSGGRPFGDRETEFGRASGVGFEFGGWVNDRHTAGLTAGGFLVEQRTRTARDAGGPAGLARPFTDAVTAQPGAFTVADPGLGVTGSLATSQGIRLSGFDVGGVSNLLYGCNVSADYTAGFRYLDLDEFLRIDQRTSVPAGLALPLGGVATPTDAARGLSLTDRFRTRNQFYGPQVGLRGEYRTGGFFAGLSTKVGVGNVRQRVDIDGRTEVTGRPAVPGGLLALPGANFGQEVVNRFAVLVDVGVAAGYQFAPWGRARVGYDFLYLNDVVRPGLQADPVINTALVPSSAAFGGVSGLRSPIRPQRTDDFFAHGFRVGLELLY